MSDYRKTRPHNNSEDIDLYRRSSYGSGRSSSEGRRYHGYDDAYAHRSQRSARSSAVRTQAARSRQNNAQMYASARGMGRRKNDNQYLDRQRQHYAANAQNYRRGTEAARPASPLSIIVRAVIVVVLLLVLVVRFSVQGGVLGQADQLNAQAAEQQTQLEQVTGSNEKLQGNIDSRQKTIDAWNKLTANS